MQNPKKIVSSNPTPEVRRQSLTIEGVGFYPDENVWRIPTAQGPAVFDFMSLPGVSKDLRELCKEAFTALLLSNAPERLTRLLSRLRVLFRYLVATDTARIIGELTAHDIQNYGSSLPKNQQYGLQKVKEVLVAWAKTGVGGLSRDLLLFLPGLETVCHETGAAVRTMDPRKGPLTDVEYESVVAAVHQSFASGTMSLADYTLMILGITLGARAMQLAMIKTKDLSITQRADGSKIYILQVTRLKQGKNIRPRMLFRSRQLSAAVGALVEQQVVASVAWAEPNGILSTEAPLFPSTSSAPQERRVVLPNLRGHCDGKSMSERICRTLKKLNVSSSRTGNPINLFQTRLRRTFGSRAAAEGLPASVIADLMDHSWVDSSLVYIETRPEIIERIDKGLALKIAPLAQAFAGTLVERHVQPSTGSLSKIIYFSEPDALEATGGCGKFDFCGLAAPLACYTCSYFNPWIDDIHERLLETLIAEREELLQKADQRIAAVNDRTIFAVADVVNRCRGAMQKGAR